MTQEEKIYYENVRANPKDPVFDRLFTQNRDGSVQAIPGVIFKLWNGIPYIEDLTPLQSLYDQGFLSTQTTLQDIYVKGSDLDEYSRQVALDSPFGKDSVFYTSYACPSDSPYADPEKYDFYYNVIFCSSGTEVFEKYRTTAIPNKMNFNVFIEHENKEKSNFFGTACKVSFGEGMGEYIQRKFISHRDGVSLFDESNKLIGRGSGLKGLCENILKSYGITKNTEIVEAMENAIRLELLGESEANLLVNTLLSQTSKLSDWLKSGVERLEKYKLKEENYDYDTYYFKPVNSYPPKTATYRPVIPIPIDSGKDRILASAAKKLKELASGFSGTLFSSSPNTVAALAWASYLQQLLPDEITKPLVSLKDLITEITGILQEMENLAIEQAALLNAMLCGLINGLISLIQMAVSLLAMAADGMTVSNPITQLDEYREKLEFIEDFIDLIRENALPVLKSIREYISDWRNREDFKNFLRELERKVTGLNRYFWAYFIGAAVFELILDAVTAYFTGGTSLIAEASAKISRMAAQAEKLAQKGIQLSRRTLEKVADSLAGLIRWLKRELEELVLAIKNKQFISFLKKKLLQLFGIKFVSKIENLDQLRDFINIIDEQFIVEDLANAGIEVLFRGTTKDIHGNPFPGNSNTILNGLSTSVDPVVATIFAIESSTINGTKGIIQVIQPSNLKNISLMPSNIRRQLELEIILKISAKDLTQSKGIIELSIDEARKLIKQIYNIELPSKINNSDTSRYLLETTERLDLKQSTKILKKIKL